MADRTTQNEPRDLAPDLVGVKSRVSWPAIIAGTVVALACYLVLTLLFLAVGLSLTEAGVRNNAVGTGVLVATILSLVTSLFLGGWVASQMTVGENHQEAGIYGILTWAAFMAVTMFLIASGVKAGYYAAVGGSLVAQNEGITVEELGRRANLPESEIAALRARVDANRARADVLGPVNTEEKAREAAMAAAWIALVGTMLSMAAAVGGALVGKGTSFRLFPVAVVRRQDSARVAVSPA
jgi:hypothetical protein